LEPPKYFPSNVNINKEGYDESEQIIDKNLNALEPNEIEKKLINEDIIILDVRGAAEFANSHIPGSIFIGLDGRFAPWVGEILEDVFKQMILIVPKGREKEAVLRLSRVGFDNVLGYLKGGIQNWIDSGKQITKVENEPALNFSDHNLKQIKNILDVRSKSEYSSESLEKSLNIPLPELIHSLNKVNFNDKFYVHCKGGYRSMIAASILLSKGISKFANIPGGFDEIKKFQA
ncbi:MAG: rhodanese-like domain-containing protein, partial [Cryomorphaceae bacterium]|nr:rhodanese-like domain-containing protein [Cryomorphaceae bacterium]